MTAERLKNIKNGKTIKKSNLRLGSNLDQNVGVRVHKVVSYNLTKKSENPSVKMIVSVHSSQRRDFWTYVRQKILVYSKWNFHLGILDKKP